MKFAQSVARAIVQMHMADATSLFSGEKFKQGIDGTNHPAKLARSGPWCNCWILGYSSSGNGRTSLISPARVELLVNGLESLAVDVGVDLRR